MADMTSAPDNGEASAVMDYLRLFRFPNVFTAIADIAMGFVFVHSGFEPVFVLVLLVLASSCLYTAGMVLNDVNDIEADSRERPERPLPAGRISRARAAAIGYGLLVGGVLAAAAGGYLQPIDGAMPWRGCAVASMLAICVVLYDSTLKSTPIGPIAMGACRFFNVLLGMSMAVPIVGANTFWGYGQHHLAAAGGIGVYIVGVTWFARNEAGKSSKPQLAMATAVMMAGIALLALVRRAAPNGFPSSQLTEQTYYLLLGLLAFTILRRCGIAISNPTPQQVQFAVKHGILSLIVLNAAVALGVSQWYYALAILCLLIPTLILGRWIYST